MLKRPRVAIDARHMESGIGTYVSQLLSAVGRSDLPFDVVAVGRRGLRDRLAGVSGISEIRVVEAPLYSLRAQLLLPLRTADCGLFHAIHYDLPLFHPRSVVVTIHDVIHLSKEFVPSAAAAAYARAMLTLAARRARHIITVSEFSKQQIVEHLGVDASRITVIYNGVGPEFHPMDPEEAFREVRAELPLRRPYLLYVGNLKPHKNVGRLIGAFALLCQRKRLDHQLVIVGDDKKQAVHLEQQCAQQGIAERVTFLPRVAARLLPLIYAAADLLILPSLVEGFGLPVVEAMACGTPVACSTAASLPEVVGQAAELFDPLSEESMAEAIDRVLRSSEIRERFRAEGVERAARFSRDACAQEHFRVYARLLGV